MQKEVGGVTPGAFQGSADGTELALHSPLRAWWLVFVVMALQTTSMLDRNILAIMLIEIRHDLGLNDFEAAILTGFAFSAFYCIAGLLIGALVDRFSIRKILYLSVTLWSVAASCVGLARNFWAMAAARMMTGVGEGGVNPSAQVLISAAFPKNKVSLPMSLFTVAGTIGIGASYYGGGLLLEALANHPFPGLESLAPWRQVLIVTSLPGIVVAFLAFTVSEPANKTAPGAKAATWREFGAYLWEERSLLIRYCIAIGMLSAVNYGMSAWTPTYGRRVLGVSPAEIGGLMAAIFLFVGAPAPALYGYLVDRSFTRGRIDAALRTFAIGVLLALPFFVVGYLLDNKIALIVSVISTQFAFFTPSGCGFAAIAMITPPAMRGRMAALFVVAMNFGGYAFGPGLVGALTDFVFHDPQKVGYSIALLGAVFCPISAWLAWSARGRFVARIAKLNG